MLTYRFLAKDELEQLEQLIEEVKLLNKGGKLLDESLNKGFNELSRALANRKGDGSTEIYIPDTLISAFPREVLDLLRDRLNQEKNQPIVIVQQPFSELFNPIFLYSFLGVLLALMCFLIYKTNKDCCCSDKSTPEEEKDEDWINKIKSLITKKEILVQVSYQLEDKRLVEVVGTLCKTESKSFIGLLTNEGLLLIREDKIITIKEISNEQSQNHANRH